MSTINRLRRSAGSTSPYARPTSFSYGPTSPNEVPSNVGDSTREISIRVMRACASGTTSKVTSPINPLKFRTALSPFPRPRMIGGDRILLRIRLQARAQGGQYAEYALFIPCWYACKLLKTNALGPRITSLGNDVLYKAEASMSGGGDTVRFGVFEADLQARELRKHR